MIGADVLDPDGDPVLSQVLDATDGPLYVVNPSGDTVGEVIADLTARADAPSIRLVAAEDVLKAVMDDFLLASTAADLVAEDGLSLAQLERAPKHCLVVSERRTVSIVTVGYRRAGLSTDSGTFVTDVWDYYDSRWPELDTYALRTPPLTRIRESLEADIGPAVARDFDAVIESLESAGGEDELDEVMVSLLVAARNRILLYDISKWGEDIGLASKATFSRTKTVLEQEGLIETEKVPIDVGRPRLRLLPGDERVADADPADLARVTGAILAG